MLVIIPKHQKSDYQQHNKTVLTYQKYVLLLNQ